MQTCMNVIRRTRATRMRDHRMRLWRSLFCFGFDNLATGLWIRRYRNTSRFKEDVLRCLSLNVRWTPLPRALPAHTFNLVLATNRGPGAIILPEPEFHGSGLARAAPAAGKKPPASQGSLGSNKAFLSIPESTSIS